MFERFAFLAVGVIGVAGALMLLARSWRWRTAALAAQYFGVFWLVALTWSPGFAAIKLVTGWMAAAILGASRIDQLPSDRRRWPTERLFYGLVILIVFISVSVLAPQLALLIPNFHLAQAQGGLLLISLGMVHLGVTARGMRVILSLLTLLAGFEILYAAIETSALVAGLLAAVDLGVAVVGAYLLTNISEEEE